jgi:thimet oligopeptidase
MSEKFERPTIPILDAATMLAASRQIFREAREAFARMEQIPLSDITAENLLDEWDRITASAENILGPSSILGSVHPSAVLRDASEEVMVEATNFHTEVFQNEKLFERVRAVKTENDAQKQLQKDLLESFEDSGVALPAERRGRVREILEELERLNQQFDRNVRDNETKLKFAPHETKGLPASYLERVPKDEEGNIVVGFDYPDYVPFMTNVENSEARKRYYIAYNNRGTAENVDILDRIVELRRELAGLYDLPSYAHYITRRQMAETPAAVHEFLRDVEKVVAEAEKSDLDELRALKAEVSGTPLDDTRIERWDHGFYAERLRQQRFNVDQEELRSYFPTIPTVRWVLSVTSKLYGIRFEEAHVPVWHEDVLYFDLFDRDTDAFIGGIYLDLYPRDGKYKHAAAWGVRGGSRKSGRTPISVLVCNFDRNGLTHNELETLFHEFGHVMHGVLSRTEYVTHSGTSVERDFVEAPSQMYEEWARKLESLRTLQELSPDSPPIDATIVERLGASRRFGRGINYARQHLYATFDMSLASETPRKSLETWQEMEGRTPMGYVDDTAFPGTFGHIAGDYAAGYYGYMWSEVLALDMLSAFGDDLMNEETGHRFRDMILSRGGEQPARTMVRNFLGREVNSAAFFAEITGRR